MVCLKYTNFLIKQIAYELHNLNHLFCVSCYKKADAIMHQLFALRG